MICDIYLFFKWKVFLKLRERALFILGDTILILLLLSDSSKFKFWVILHFWTFDFGQVIEWERFELASYSGRPT